MEKILNVAQKDNKMDLLPKILSDYVPLPSDGLFYENKINRLMVEYMTASDEQYLLSENYMKSGSSFELLLKNKIKDPDFLNSMTIDDLLIGDFDAILLYLRRFAYGDTYEVSVRDTNGEYFKAEVDLEKLEPKKIIEPNHDLMFEFMLPMTKQNVVFKLLTYGDKKRFDERIEKLSKYKNEPLFEIQEKIISQIYSIAGETDRIFIEKYVKMMPPKDSLALRLYMVQVEPGIDFSYEFQGKFTGDFFRQKVNIDIDFFYPRS